MAVLQRFQLARETEQEIEYRFGFPELDRTMVIRKTDRTFTVPDSEEDHVTVMVFGGIVRRFLADKAWPKAGSVQH